MISKGQVETVIFRALEALNAERAADDQIEISVHTPLFRHDARIDSLGLVSLIVDVETTLNVENGLELSLTGDHAFARPQSPYATVETLRDYVLELAQAK